MFSPSKVRNAAKAVKKSAGVGVKQIAKAANENAKLQDEVVGGGSPQSVESTLSNPAATHKEDKSKVYQEVKARMNGLMTYVGTMLMQASIEPTLTALGLQDSLSTVKASGQTVGKVKLSNTTFKAFGYVIQRIADMYVLGAKLVALHAGTLFKVEAPVIQEVSDTHHESAYTSITEADVRMVVSRDEVHKIAKTYAVQAEVIKLVGNGPFLVKTDHGYIQIDQSGLVLNHGGANIVMGEGKIHLNPTVPPMPPVVLPSTPVVLVNNLRESEMLPQYDGLNPLPFKFT